MSRKNGHDPYSDFNQEYRVRLLSMPEAELRQVVDHLLEQCGREDAYPAPSSPRSQMLATEEIYRLLRLKSIDYGNLREAIEGTGEQE